jgi:flagellar motility protein MotE (MotC chaperone)
MTNILHLSDKEVAEIQSRLQKQKAADSPFSEQRFPKIESKEMNKEVKKVMDDLGEEALLRDKQIGKRLVELKDLAEEMKHILHRK